MKTISLITAVLILCYSCEKDEIPIRPHETGDAIIIQTEVSTYSDQLYFDLGTGTFVKQNAKTEWDLAFGCGEFGELIFSNTAKSTAVARIENGNFSETTSIEGLEFIFESSTGHKDSTAFDQWQNTDLFIIDLGYTHSGVHQGYGKLMITENNDTEWKIKCGYLAETTPTEVALKKNDTHNTIFFSFITKATADIEPPKANWDLCFTQYIHHFHEFDTPYLVSGVLLNRSNVSAYQHKSTDFLNIDFEDVNTEELSPFLDAIGFDWKTYAGEGFYIVYPEDNFIVKSTEGYIYKLHFTGFHGESGEKGFPKVELQAL